MISWAWVRSQLADPDFMNKAKAGHADEIRKCIGCLYCRERVLGQGLPIRCAINARTAREDVFSHIRKDGAGKTAVVVGGGPAGMEAARVLALRQFHVVLFEKEAKLGGTLNVADKPAFKDKLTRLSETMETQIRHLGVEVRLDTAATPELVSALNPVGIVVACGAEPVIPPLPGMQQNHVCTAEDVLTGKANPTGQVAVIGSGLTGLETSEMLLSRGLSVSIVEMASEMGPGIFGAIRNDELSRILPHNPGIYTGHKLLSIEGKTVTMEKIDDHSTVVIPADSVVLALGVRPRSALAESFESCCPQVHIVGDARRGGRIATAVREGFEAAYIFEA